MRELRDLAAAVGGLLFYLVEVGFIPCLVSYLAAALAGVYAGQKLAWLIYCKRNPDLTKEEE